MNLRYRHKVQRLGDGIMRAWSLGAYTRMEDRSFALKAEMPAADKAVALMRQQFERVASEVACEACGSTATLAWLGPDQVLTVGTLGDSPALLLTQDKDWFPDAFELNTLHSPLEPKEAERLADPALGAIVREDRLWDPDLPRSVAVSRGLGDKDIPGLISMPEVRQYDLSVVTQAHRRAFLCVASDGILSPTLGAAYLACDAPVEAFEGVCDYAAWLVDNSRTMQSHDNVTALLVDLRKQPRNLALGVFDGHDGPKVAARASRMFRVLAKGLG